MNTTIENPRSQFKVALNYGTLSALSSISIFLIFYFIGTDIQSKTPQYLGYVILIIFLILGIKSYRDNDLGGFMTYGKSLGTGTLISLCAGFISAIFTIIFFKYIAPDMIQKILDTAQQNMADKGLSEEQIQMSMSYAAKFMTPVWLFLFSVLGTTIMGLIFSLLISIFMKKEANPFNTNIG
jgi:hypothetical protein